MRKKTVPGQRSNVALLISGVWTSLSLFIIITGHLVIAFYVYGIFTDTNGIADLHTWCIPTLSIGALYGLAAAAIGIDIWMVISQKKAFDKQFER
ncbi:MAG: hypothetical protein R8M45_10010 [Ghiorsea sp.]